MRKPYATRVGISDHLTVIHKASLIPDTPTEDIHTAVLQTDLSFNLTGWNSEAEKLHGRPDAIGRHLFSLIDITFLEGDLNELRYDLHAKGIWSGEVIYNREDGKQIHFRTTATYIFDKDGAPVSILIVNHNISDIKAKENQLAAAEKKYEMLVNTLPQGVVMISVDGKIATCNKRAAEILGLTEQELLGRLTASPAWNAIRPDGSVFPLTEFPAVVSLQTGFPQRNVVMGIRQPNEELIWISINSEALIRSGEFDPYAVVVSYSDISDSLNREKELRKSNERFYYVSKVTSDAIWDIDLETNIIYRSEAFSKLSGYMQPEINANLDWWFDRVHIEDRDRVKSKLNEHILKGIERWDDEYRFQCADGTYKFLSDSGIILYRHGKPSRVLGAIRDLTDKKKLEKQLLEEQSQRHKAITQASITAQEEEKANISRELHDNVNQILMSAKLFMDTAKKTPEQCNDLLDKAIEYQLMALQEIRKLSKSLSTSHIKTVGLKDSVTDIVRNMKLLQQLDVHFIFNKRVEEKLSEGHKLMLFRIIQEQTSNIIKHAEARTVQIMINEMNEMVHLVISDDGKGFDPSANNSKGIGFINMTSRCEAYNGRVNISSSPGNGCSIELCFPLVS
jgi:PAS domain S-box-containing protein